MATTIPQFVRGAGLLGFDGFSAVTRVVEAMHADIAGRQMPWHRDRSPRTRGLTGQVYRSIHAVGQGARWCFDQALSPFARLGSGVDGEGAAAFVAAVNGVVGDHLEASANPLAQPMRLRLDGHDLTLDRASLRKDLAVPGDRIVVLVHGLCMNDRQWQRDDASHADALREHGRTVLHLVYNSGRHISVNGREFSALLERLVASWPVPLAGIEVLAHSMGGLVTRSACHYGTGAAWRPLLRRIVFLGSPHQGAALERGGNRFERVTGHIPFAAALARLGTARSAGITDLRFGNLLDTDWHGVDRFGPAGDRRQVVPLPTGVDCHAVAGTQGTQEGDGLVAVASALGEHADPARDLGLPPDRKHRLDETGHFDLLYGSAARDCVTRCFADR